MQHFVTTRWSLVVSAGAERTPVGQEALAALCELYWYPLYAYLRRRGHDADDAQDWTQGFFAYLLEHHALQAADRSRGRFRSFLLASLNHYVSNVRDRDHAQKRGGRTARISLDTYTAEERFIGEPADVRTPESIFDRSWAITVLDRVLTRVRIEFDAQGKGDLFSHLKGHLTGDPREVSYRELGLALGMTEGAVKQAVHRLRRHYRETLYDEIAGTVATADEVDGEIQYLMSAVAQ
jgi:DNA-directed RNA polymerase specialized sigma24 family protein